MGINITHTNSFQFENRENLRNTARNILNRKGASPETMQKIIDKTIFDTKAFYNNSGVSANIAQQIAINNSLKETLKYLKNNKKPAKKPVLGELYNIVSDKEDNYQGELSDFEIDNSIKNIFIAA